MVVYDEEYRAWSRATWRFDGKRTDNAPAGTAMVFAVRKRVKGRAYDQIINSGRYKKNGTCTNLHIGQAETSLSLCHGTIPCSASVLTVEAYLSINQWMKYLLSSGDHSAIAAFQGQTAKDFRPLLPSALTSPCSIEKIPVVLQLVLALVSPAKSGVGLSIDDRASHDSDSCVVPFRACVPDAVFLLDPLSGPSLLP